MVTNSILAGIMIGIGDIALMSCDSKYIGALLFSVALMSVIFFELPLFTGRVGRMVRDGNYLYCFFVLFFNVIGGKIGIKSGFLLRESLNQSTMKNKTIAEILNEYTEKVNILIDKISRVS